MAKLRIKSGDWVVVCDGAKALILENVGDSVFPNLRTKEVHTQPDRPTREQGTDKPGQVFQSVGDKRSTMEQTDWHEQSEQQFLDALAGRLDAALNAGEAKTLVIVAAPRALGILRQAYSPQVRDAIKAEIHKDYVRLPVHEIEKHLAA
jgi:protein required for attachment to host cells